jgi:amicyanin
MKLVIFIIFSITCLNSYAAEVDMIKMKFVPREITIKKGETVTWINKSKLMHNVVHKKSKDQPKRLFKSKLIRKKKTFSHKFNEVGVYNYLCTPHKNNRMKGKVIVIEDSSDTSYDNSDTVISNSSDTLIK